MMSEETSTARRWPAFLIVWIVVQAIGLVFGPLLSSSRDYALPSFIFWAAVTAALVYALLNHSKVAWIMALVFAGLGLAGSIRIITALSLGWGAEVLRLAFGFVFSVASLAALLSPQAREWVNQPTIRRWDP